MLTHGEIWAAIDKLAERHGLSTSGLAKRAGLDPTTFNRSKRVTPDGRSRWPSTESLSKILAATGETVDGFMTLLSGVSMTRRTVPLIGLAQAGAGGYFDDGGFPVGTGWDAVEFPSISDEHAYALEVTGDSMAPAYKDGCVIIVAPGAPVRRGDRVVVRLRDGEVMAKELKRLSAKTIELRSLNPEHADHAFARDDIAWIARIMWASQ